jgi:hypothetical protein
MVFLPMRTILRDEIVSGPLSSDIPIHDRRNGHAHSPFTTERDADLVHLLGGHIVDGDDEDGLVVLEERLSRVLLAYCSATTACADVSGVNAHLELIKVSDLVCFCDHFGG